MAPEIVSQMEDCLKGMEITPVDTSTYKGGEGAESLSLLSTATFDHLFPESRPGGVNDAQLFFFTTRLLIAEATRLYVLSYHKFE